MTQSSALDAQSCWSDLVATALVGAGRLPLRLPPSGEPLGDMLGELDASDPERTLLGAAAALTLYRRAGRLPERSTGPLPELCPPDELAPCAPQASRHLVMMLCGTHPKVLPEWLTALAQTGRRLPAEHLVALLELGRRQEALREALLPVLGTRGCWLAAQNPDWDYAASGLNQATLSAQSDILKTQWETESRAARIALFKQLRRTLPDLARDLLAATWPSEQLDDRKAFIELFAVGLSMDDEPFLEASLDDRSMEVRSAVAHLLGQLAESRLNRRMFERVAGSLTLQIGRKPRIEIVLPEAYDKAMQRDGVKKDAPKIYKIGPKAWWLQQMLGFVPPAYWCDQWRITPAQLLEATKNSEWTDLLREAWVAGAGHAHDHAFIELLLPVYLELNDHNKLHLLTEQLPLDRVEAHIVDILEHSIQPLSGYHPVLTLLRSFAHPWSERLARAVIANLARWLDTPQGILLRVDWYIHDALNEFALHFPPQLADEVAVAWISRTEKQKDWEEAVEVFLNVLRFRQEIHAALNETDAGVARAISPAADLPS
ncbi:MAG: DUF5691 domain-containing protein [Chloroflexales bacterium]|nr:DUF5691 domain-containing protein [Chloroflexales bacterium]